MKCRVMLLLCMLAAGSAQASGITSFEPDTTARVSRDREPMVDTPIWLGSTWNLASEYQTQAKGLTRGPMHLSEFGISATWPWRSRLQSFAEWRYGVRHVRYSYRSASFTDEFTEDYPMFALRGGTEYRFGRRSRPWCTAGGGVGYALDAGRSPVAAYEMIARTTLFMYPTPNTRLGLMLSAGPTWFVYESGFYFAGGGSADERDVRTNFAVTLRVERRLRFPKANADADAAD